MIRLALVVALLLWADGTAARERKKLNIEGKQFDIVRIEKDGAHSYTVLAKHRVDGGDLLAEIKVRVVWDK